VRKPIWALAVLVLATSVPACSNDGDGAENATAAPGDTTTTSFQAAPIVCDDQPASVTEVGDPSDFTPVTADTLTVATSLPAPGFWNGSDDDPTDVTGGFEYDLAKKLQDAFGLPNLRVRNVSFVDLVDGQVQDYDLALSQVPITCARTESVQFSLPYFASNQGALVKKDFAKPLTSVEDARQIRWGVQTSSDAVDVLGRVQPVAEPRSYEQLADGYAALQAGQIEAFLADTAINLGQAARSSGGLVVPVQLSQPGGPDQYGAILPHDSANAGAVNAVLEELRDSGALQQLAQSNLTADPGSLPVIDVP
jgi:polar amino acid transport system substrate-binding protein